MTSPTSRETLLVNFFYCHPVGHAVKALKYCLGYHRADPSRRISLVLNRDTATELVALCDFVTELHPISHPMVTLHRIPTRHSWPSP